MITVNSGNERFSSRNSKSKQEIAKAVDLVVSQAITINEEHKDATFTSEELFGAPSSRYYEFCVALRSDKRILALVSNNAKNVDFSHKDASGNKLQHAFFNKMALRDVSLSAIKQLRAEASKK